MYAFVRITAVIFMLLGILIMIAGIVTGAVGGWNLVQNPAPSGSLLSFMNPSILSLGMGAVMLFQGLMITAFGQLMIVIVDIARATQETAIQLRSLRRSE